MIPKPWKDKTKPSSYRPTSILTCLPKLFENLLLRIGPTSKHTTHSHRTNLGFGQNIEPLNRLTASQQKFARPGKYNKYRSVTGEDPSLVWWPMPLCWNREKSDQSAWEGPPPGIAKDSEFSALVSQAVIPPVPISLPQGSIESGLPAQGGTSEIQSAGPKPLAVVPLRKQIFVSRLSPDQTSFDLLSYIEDKTKADNMKVEKFNLL